MKKNLWILWILIVVLGVCGCMRNEPENTTDAFLKDDAFTKIGLEQMETELLAYLNEKYGESFEMDKLVLEFGGIDIYYRAVFHSSNRPEKGVLYCRTEGAGTSVRISGVDCVLTDDYANVLLQEQYAAMIQAELGSEVMVKCRVDTTGGMLTTEELAEGVDACLEHNELEPHVYVIILADSSARDGALKAQAEAFMSQRNVYRQYLYIGYAPQLDLQEWKQRYLKHNAEFERYLVDESDAECVEFSAFHLDEGLVKSSVVKE